MAKNLEKDGRTIVETTNEEFNINDRVMYVANCDNFTALNKIIKKGMKATIVDKKIYGPFFTYSLDFDNFIYGHNCNQKAKNGHGWNFSNLKGFKKISE